MRAIDVAALADIPGLIRCEQFDREALAEQITEMTHTVYPHEQVYGQYCTIHAHIACPPEEVFAYMANTYSLMEWTYSVRDLIPTTEPGLLRGFDSGHTPIYCRTVSNREALTVDYHCAWDQGDELWMIYLNRIVPAETVLKQPGAVVIWTNCRHQTVLKQPGAVVIWTNCRHPYYAQNPFPALNRDPEREWVGDWWPLFYAGHSIELSNLKAILEYRHRAGLPIGPHLREVST